RCLRHRLHRGGMPVVGTAGHVDHGKSTLVQALTGRDPDRWDEEKRRGLTIDLGFAWTTLDGDLDVGFIDVPGHERFIKNMLAGVDAIDVALFVVAADEGWMPQSEEHLAVLDLLGITSGVIALTRCDVVDQDLADLAELEVRERLEGTSLADAPILRTGAPAGLGIEEVRAALGSALRSIVSDPSGRPRMWVDRSFTIGGAGTVVTGTLLDGPVAVGDTLAVWPDARQARVRSLQSHEQSLDRVGPGARVALNLVGLDRGEVPRGAMLGRADQWRTTTRIVVELRTIRSLDEPLRDRGAFHLHVGSGAFPARIRLLEGSVLEGSGAAVITVDEPLTLKTGDRLILREVGRRAVVAGGWVLDPSPPQRGQDLREALPLLRGCGPSPDDRAGALLAVRGIDDLAHLAADTGGGRPPGALIIGGKALDPGEVPRLASLALAAALEFQEANPLRAGMPKPSLAERLGVGLMVLDAVIAADDRLSDDGAVVRTSEFSGGLDAAAKEAWEGVRGDLQAAGWGVPRRSELGLDSEVIHALLRDGSLVAVDDFAYLPEQLDELVERVRTMDDGFGVADFRDQFGVTRKHAVPLLEWLDRNRITRREGDQRVVRRSPPGEPAPGGAPSR
ncbi:MAG: selenocysteine-specific translation elongation factor, partial [Acidimicrobiia bacterium]|nr:selenocysteine-specific translation elongation factor [Acidimicrobiia bacterium]